LYEIGGRNLPECSSYSAQCESATRCGVAETARPSQARSKAKLKREDDGLNGKKEARIRLFSRNMHDCTTLLVG
jgi:hypothetical protein